MFLKIMTGFSIQVSLTLAAATGWVLLLMWPFAELYFKYTSPYIFTTISIPIVQVTICVAMLLLKWKSESTKTTYVAAIAIIGMLATILSVVIFETTDFRAIIPNRTKVTLYEMRRHPASSPSPTLTAT